MNNLLEDILYKKIISITLVVALLNLLGCYSSELITVPEYKQIEDADKPNDIMVKTKRSKLYHFTESNFYIEDDTLIGRVNEKEMTIKGKIPLREIETIQTSSFIGSVSEYENIETKLGKPNEIYVIKYDSKRYHFLKDDYYIEDDTLFGKGKLILSDNEQKIALSDIESIKMEHFDGSKTTLLVVGLVAVLVIVLVASSVNFGGGLNLGEL